MITVENSALEISLEQRRFKKALSTLHSDGRAFSLHVTVNAEWAACVSPNPHISRVVAVGRYNAVEAI